MKAVIYRNVEYPYSKIFWGEDKNRKYEHEADARALANAISSKEKEPYLLDIGGGFGRLVPVLKQFAEKVIIVDSSMDLLREAKEKFGNDPSVHYICANLYHLPFRDASVGSAACMRVMHHIENPEAAFRELNRVVTKNVYLEFPNKRHALQLYRFFVKKDARMDVLSSHMELRDGMFYNFTLSFIRSRILRYTVFSIEKVIGVSFFRQNNIKRLMPLRVLLLLEGICQQLPFLAELAPSIMLRLSKRSRHVAQEFSTILACPICHAELHESGMHRFTCAGGHTYAEQDGILNVYVG